MSALKATPSATIDASNRNNISGREGLVRFGRNLGILGAAALALTAVTPSLALTQRTLEDGAGPRRPAMAYTAMQERQGSSRSFRLRRASADAVRPALLARGQARVLRALVEEFENRVWQVEPITLSAVVTVPLVDVTIPSSTIALDKLVTEYEARIWGTGQVNSDAISIDSSLTSEASSTSEVLEELMASFEESVWRTNVIETMPVIHVPVGPTVSNSAADVLSALVQDFEAKVWTPAVTTNVAVPVQFPAALTGVAY